METRIETQASAARAAETERLRRSVAEKRRIIEATFEPGASVARVARTNGVNANQVYFWRGQYRAGKLGAGAQTRQALLPVRVAAEPRVRQRREARPSAGTIEVELRQGRLRVEAGADAGLGGADAGAVGDAAGGH